MVNCEQSLIFTAENNRAGSERVARDSEDTHLFSESRGTHVIGPLLYIFVLQYSVFHGEAFLTRVVESITEHSIPNLCYDHDFRNNRRLLIGNYCSQGETRPL